MANKTTNRSKITPIGLIDKKDVAKLTDAYGKKTFSEIREGLGKKTIKKK